MQALEAFVHYTNITAASEAIKYFREEMYHDCHITCRFGSKRPSDAIWIDVSKNDELVYLNDSAEMLSALGSYGTVMKYRLSSDKLRALVYYDTIDAAISLVK